MKKVVLVVLVAVLVAVGFAYAAKNTVPVTGAGDGTGTISGYVVSEVHYELGGNPTLISSVTLKVVPKNQSVPPAKTVEIKFDNSTSWNSCEKNDDDYLYWTCAVSPAVSVLDATQLRVVAAQ